MKFEVTMSFIMMSCYYVDNLLSMKNARALTHGAWGPFLEAPGNFTGPGSDFDIKLSRKVGRVLTSDEVHFVSLADFFTVQFSNLLKLPLE